MATLTDTVTWLAFGDRLKYLTGVNPAPGAEEDLMKDYLAMGAEHGDGYIGQDIPANKLKNAQHGALIYAATLWDYQSIPTGRTSVKTAQLAEGFANPLAHEAHHGALRAAVPFWWRASLDKSRRGKPNG